MNWFLFGIGVLFFIEVALIVFSFVRHARLLSWFYGASLLLGLLFVGCFFGYSLFLDSIVSAHPEWSLQLLSSFLNVSSILRQLVVYFFLFGLEGLLLTVMLCIFSLASGQLGTLKSFLLRAQSLGWQALFFSALTLFSALLMKDLGVLLTDTVLTQLFEFASFVFLLQLFLRLIDSPYLKTPALFLEYTFVCGLLMTLGRFLLSFWLFSWEGVDSARFFFFDQLIAFLFSFLLSGLLGTFFVRAYFISPFFLIKISQLVPFFSRLVFRLMGHEFNNPSAQIAIRKGIVLSFFLGFLLLLFLFLEWTLLLIAGFFVAYFLLFLFLDRQHNMMVRGEVVEER